MRFIGTCAALAISVLCAAAPSDPSSLVALAREAVLAEVRHDPPPTPTAGTLPHPVFVTIERNGRVLGCRGTLTIKRATLEEEVIAAARSAAAHDPRYRALRPADLRDFLVTVTVVQREESIDSVVGLSAADGLVLRSGSRTGVVLPWEGRDPSIRLRWAYTKAGVPFGSAARLSRLIADRTRG